MIDHQIEAKNLEAQRKEITEYVIYREVSCEFSRLNVQEAGYSEYKQKTTDGKSQ